MRLSEVPELESWRLQGQKQSLGKLRLGGTFGWNKQPRMPTQSLPLLGTFAASKCSLDSQLILIMVKQSPWVGNVFFIKKKYLSVLPCS